MKKKLLTLVAAVMVTLICHAVSDNGGAKYLTVTLKGGSEVSYSLENFRVTYGEGNMYVESAGEKFTLSTVSLVNMFFSETPTSISSPKVKAAVIVNTGEELLVNSERSGMLKVYSSEGAQLLFAKIKTGENAVDLSSLSKGIYVVTLNGQSVKFERK